MKNSEFNELLSFAKNLAEKAGEIISKERKRNTFTQDYKNGIELVTSVDIITDKFITKEILKNYPEHIILSEELHKSISEDKIIDNIVWIVDPIDGTVNYSLGHTQVAVSIAVAVNGQVVVGVVHAPFQNETFYAVKNSGACLNGSKIHIKDGVPFENAVIGTGFSYSKLERELQIKFSNAILRNCGDIRRLGSAALDLCWVACGRLSGYFESVKSWDMAAGALIAKESGAIVDHFIDSDLVVDDLNGVGLIASSPDIFSELLRLLKNTDVKGNIYEC